MKQLGGFIPICLFLTFCYFVGLLKFLTETEEDKCEMTYMFEYPQYVRISNMADNTFIKYGLYAYSEGRLTEKSRNMYFDGIPVLFIPGNKGSHKQVRSLASVALRKWLNSRMPYHFDYFTVDLNEEYSGFYGPLLYDQLQYVNASIYRILELYKKIKDPPNSIILIGHSMGGVVAVKLLSEMHDTNLVPIIITLASPLKRAPLILDYQTEKFYKGIFRKKLQTSVISVGGGYRDFLISPFLIEKREKDILPVTTSNIPISWTENNHVQILWCKQVVMALNRALFDSVDTKTRQISLNSTYREMTFKHHLIQHSGTNVRKHESYLKEVKINHKGKWIENLKKQYSVEHPNGLHEIHWYMVAISDFPGYEKLSILAINLEIVDWVFACNAYYIKDSSRICHEGIHMTQKSEIAPSAKYKRRFFNVDLKELKKNRSDLTHVVFRAPPTDETLEYHVDIHGNDQRTRIIQLPRWFSVAKQIIVDRTDKNAIYYELVLPQLNHIVQYYNLNLEPLECSKSEHHASVTLTVPWSNENTHGFVTTSTKKPFGVRLLSSKPPNYQNSSAVIKLILDPSCTYKISIHSSILGTFGQLARTYTPLLLANVATVALMSLRYQLKSLEKGHCSILFVAIQEGTKPYYVLTAYKVLSRLLSLWFLPPFVPIPDHMYMVDDGIDLFILPLVLYLCSIGIFWIFTIAFSISLVALESTVHKLTLKLLARTVSLNMSWSDFLMNYLHKVPIIVALTLVSLSLTTCGGLALCLGAAFYFLRLTQMSQDFVEEVGWYFAKKFARKFKNFFKKSRKTSSTDLVLRQNSGGGEPSQIETKDNNLEENTSDEKDKNNLCLELNRGKDEETRKCDDGDKNEIVNNDKPNLICEKDMQTEFEEEYSSMEDVNEQINTVSDEKGNTNDKQDKSALEEKHVPLKNMTIPSTGPNTDGDRSRNKDKSKEKYKKDNPDEDLELSSSYNAIFFHSTLFFLWLIVTVINIPAVLTWAHNFKYKTILVPDESFLPGFALSMCALALWHFEFPKTDRKWMYQLENFVMAMAVLSLVFAVISVYRLNYILTFTIIVVTLHQLFAPKIDEHGSTDNPDKTENTNKSKFLDLKMKME